MAFDPIRYEAWYRSRRGRWIADREFGLLCDLLQPAEGASLLDVGCGTGHFSRRFAAAGLSVTGLDPDPAMLESARQAGGRVRYVRGGAEALPFADGAFDCCAAVTSLCFVADPAGALREMWRVARHGVALGLLHRPSLLWWKKRRHAGYGGARWDRLPEVRGWVDRLDPPPVRAAHGYAVLGSGEGAGLRWLEERLPLARLPLGGFLAVALHKGDGIHRESHLPVPEGCRADGSRPSA